MARKQNIYGQRERERESQCPSVSDCVSLNSQEEMNQQKMKTNLSGRGNVVAQEPGQSCHLAGEVRQSPVFPQRNRQVHFGRVRSVRDTEVSKCRRVRLKTMRQTDALRRGTFSTAPILPHLLITYQATANMPANHLPLITQLHTNSAVTQTA